VRIDLHTHSTASDGTLLPGEVVRAAAAAGLDVVALTDHDTSSGWSEAVLAAEEVGLELVRGMEISTRHRGHGVHLLAYLLDATHPGLTAELDLILAGRDDRIPGTIAALRAAGLDVELGDIDAPVPGRPHVADALVARGHVADRDEAFARWLSPGRPGYVDRYAAGLTTMIGLVAAAGGVTVIAHPWGRGRRGTLTADVLAELAGAGLSGIEVDHQDHTDPDVREELRGIAADLGLIATGSSDFHGAGKQNHELGCHTTDPDSYAALLDRAATAAAASGRETPAVVGRP